MATHSSILAWELLWTEKPSGLEATGLQRVRHDLVTQQQQMSDIRLYILKILYWSIVDYQCCMTFKCTEK